MGDATPFFLYIFFCGSVVSSPGVMAGASTQGATQDAANDFSLGMGGSCCRAVAEWSCFVWRSRLSLLLANLLVSGAVLRDHILGDGGG